MVICVKSIRIWSFSGPYFPTFGLNTERYWTYLRIQSECRKIRTRKIPNMDTFQTVYALRSSLSRGFVKSNITQLNVILE